MVYKYPNEMCSFSLINSGFEKMSIAVFFGLLLLFQSSAVSENQAPFLCFEVSEDS